MSAHISKMNAQSWDILATVDEYVYMRLCIHYGISLATGV